MPPGTALYRANWSDGMSGWAGTSDWRVASGELLNDGSAFDVFEEPTIFAPFTPSTADYAIEAEIQFVRWSDEGGFGSAEASYGINARAVDTRSYQGGFCASAGIYRCPGGNEYEVFINASGATEAPAKLPYTIDGEPRRLRLEVRGNNLRLLVNDSLILETTDNRYLDPGRIGMWANRAQIVVRTFVITSL